MNIPALVVGIIVAISLVLRFKKSKLEYNKFTYSLLLVTFPFYYFAFAIYGNDYDALMLEFVAGLVFFAVGLLSLKVKPVYRFGLLALGYILHGIYDITHHIFFINAGMPVWWPEFCGAVDVLIGLYLITIAFNSRARTPHNPLTE